MNIQQFFAKLREYKFEPLTTASYVRSSEVFPIGEMGIRLCPICWLYWKESGNVVLNCNYVNAGIGLGLNREDAVSIADMADDDSEKFLEHLFGHKDVDHPE